MRAKLVESLWKNRISSESFALRKAVNDNDLPLIKERAIILIDKIKTFFTEEDTIELSYLDRLKEAVNKIDVNVDKKDSEAFINKASELDNILNEIYDFCDEKRIWLKV